MCDVMYSSSDGQGADIAIAPGPGGGAFNSRDSARTSCHSASSTALSPSDVSGNDSSSTIGTSASPRARCCDKKDERVLCAFEQTATTACAAGEIESFCLAVCLTAAVLPELYPTVHAILIHTELFSVSELSLPNVDHGGLVASPALNMLADCEKGERASWQLNPRAKRSGTEYCALHGTTDKQPCCAAGRELGTGAAARKSPADPFRNAGMTPAAAMLDSVTANLRFVGDPQRTINS